MISVDDNKSKLIVQIRTDGAFGTPDGFVSWVAFDNWNDEDDIIGEGEFKLGDKEGYKELLVKLPILRTISLGKRGKKPNRKVVKLTQLLKKNGINGEIKMKDLDKAIHLAKQIIS